MRLEQTIQRLLLATWELPEAAVAPALPRGFAPLLADGRGHVSLAVERRARGRLGVGWAPGHSLVEVRTYAQAPDGRREVVVLMRRVTPAGVLCWLEGIPYRPTAVLIDRERAGAPGAGVALRFELDGEPPALPLDPPLGVHESVVVGRRPRRIEVRLGPVRWRSARIRGEPRVDPVLALGFDVGQPRWALYAEDVPFVAELPARALTR